MKKNFTFSLLLSIVIFYTFTNNSNNVTGGQSWASCGGCHSSSSNTIVDSIKLLNLTTGALMTGFMPDSIYKIRMVSHNTTGVGTYGGFGFQLRTMNSTSSATAGSFNGTLPSGTGTQSSGTILTHNSVLSPTGNDYIVEVNWKAPSAGAGITSVNLQSVVNAVNQDGSSSNDQYSNTVKTVNYPVLGLIGNLNCGGGSTTGTLTSTVAASGVSFTIPYTGGNGGAHSGQVVSSTGVTGLTATLGSGTFTTSTGNLIYTVTGTPTSSGTASFALNIGTKTCTYTITVTAPAGAISALNCASGTRTGSLTNSLAASGVSFTVPYTGGNTGTYSAQNVSSTGVTGLTANITAGNFANGAGNLTYTISGTPTSTGTATFPLTIGGQSCNFTFTVNPLPGIISTLNCSASKKSGTFVMNQAANGTDTVPYTGGNGGVHSGQVVNSTGVTGLQANLAAGSVNLNNGNFIYTITGTPTSAGKAIFALNILGKTCSDTVTVSLPSGTITTLDCTNGTNSGSAAQGVPATGVSFTIPYSGGNSGTHSGQTVTSTNVTGLTATLAAGTFSSNTGSLTYNVSGTAASSGSADFALNIGGQTCAYSISVLAGTVAALNCASGKLEGSLVNGATAAGVSFKIPYTAGNGGGHNGQVVSSTGVTGLTATLSSGSFVNGNDTLTYTLTGTPSGIGNANFALNVGGKNCTFIAPVITGAISNLDCSNGTTNGSLQALISATGVSFSVPYSGGNAGSHNGQIVSSTSVTGLTAKLDTSSFVSGSGTLTYNVTGTPNIAGSADFMLNIGGKSCLYSISVAPPIGVITALNCGTGVTTGTLVNGTPATGVSFSIPYTGGNKGTYSSFSVNSTGVTGLTASINNGLFNTGNGNLTFTVSGTPSGAGTASFLLDIAGKQCTYTISVKLHNGVVSDIDCANASYTGSLNQSLAASGVSFTIPYISGNGGLYSSISIPSTGVTGLTANAAADTFAYGDSVIKFTVTGTPTSFGQANFKVKFGGDSCDYSMVVNYPFASVTALNCSSGTSTDTLIRNAVSTGVTFTIPYTGGNKGTYIAQTINSTGVTGLTATLLADTLKLGAGSLTYEVTGTPNSIGTATFPISIGGRTCNFTKPVIHPIGIVNSLHCDSGVLYHQDIFMATIPFKNNVTYTVPYKGSNGGSYTAKSVNSSSVLGLTASLSAGVLHTGDSSVKFTISGTPTSAGVADFNIELGGQTCFFSVNVVPLLEASVTSIECFNGKTNGILIKNKPVTAGTTIQIPYDGGNKGYILPQIISSTGVTGLTATLAKTQVAIGYGILTYTISGTPNSDGNASFIFNIGDKFCTYDAFVRSNVGQANNLYCGNGTINTDILVGTLTDSIPFKIPYEGGNGGPYNAQSIESQTVTGLKAFIPAGLFNIGYGELTYKMTGTSSNAGNALFVISFGNASCTYAVKINSNGSSVSIVDKDIFVYQNGNQIHVKNNTESNTYKISDISGKTLKTGKIDQFDAQINISDLPKGIIFMNLENKKGSSNYKFSVE